jgi:hypothetical protein
VFVTHHFRFAVCGTALVAGLWYFATAAAAPTLPAATQKKVIEADIATIKQQLKYVIENPTELNAKAAAWTAKSLAMSLALNAEATGDTALRDQALKIVESSKKLSAAVKPRPAMRDAKAVVDSAKAIADLADKLAHKPGKAPLAPGEAYKQSDKYDYDLWQIMTPFRPSDRGGTNIEKDIRDMLNKAAPLKVDPAAVEILAARTVAIGEMAFHYPNDKAKMNAANTKEWEKLSRDMVGISQKIVAEASKGKGASEKELLKLLDNLNNNCYKCHSEYRDE